MTAGEEWFLGWGARRIALPDGEHVLGRSRDSDVVVRDATVSRAHALLAVAGGRVTVQDLGSSNGTLVNGEPVREETELAAGDQLRLGRVRMTLGSAAAGAAAAAGGGSVAATLCPACGAAVDPGAAECPRCGESLSGGRPLSRSEAVAMSEVMAVGEALARPPRSLEDTLPPFPAVWEEPAGGGGPDEGPDDEDESALASLAAPPHREPPREALEDASSPVAVARAAEEDSPPPHPPGGGAAGEPDDGDADEAAEDGLDGAESVERPPLFLPAAGFWERTAAGAIDLAGPLALAIVVAVAVSGWRLAAGGLAVGVGVGVAAWLAVTVPGWRRGGDSPGKRLLGLRVCDLDGRPGIDGRRALIRFAGYLLGVLTLGTGFLLGGLTAGRRGLHDRLAGTYVGRVGRRSVANIGRER
ncbi:MAG TPA: FHA domain-containing protein [Thermoanaerobaculia bacterium]